jgi:hydrogenase expression/formation protein HypD
VNSFEQFRDKKHVEDLVKKLHRVYPGGTMKIMEVCGTHTMAIARFGIRSILPEGLALISGPGCPVCVTPSSVIRQALELSQRVENTIVTFGDMMRVPTGNQTLEMRKAEGADIRIVYSVLDMIEMAKKDPDRNFVFISVGFETTTPGTALAVLEAEKQELENVFFLLANRRVIPALHALAAAPDIQIRGFLCPGHVSVIIGYGAYHDISERYSIPCVIAGFEPVDILMAIDDIVARIAQGAAGVGNAYGRVVTESGNSRALEIMDRIFEPVDAPWRGIGVIPQSGLTFRREYEHFDALRKFGIRHMAIREPAVKQPAVKQPANHDVSDDEPAGCRCGDVLKGVILPTECALFGNRCTPSTPVGPCMVSTEGSCAAYYKYGA